MRLAGILCCKTNSTERIDTHGNLLQMGGIDAGRITAEMIEGQGRINVTIGQYPCRTMGEKPSSADSDFPVSILVF